jgi:hypothetical protein
MTRAKKAVVSTRKPPRKPKTVTVRGWVSVEDVEGWGKPYAWFHVYKTKVDAEDSLLDDKIRRAAVTVEVK